MIKGLKKLLTFLIVITILVVGGIFLYTYGRTFKNDDDEIGNTAGNIYNGGLFSEQDGNIYFSNGNDDGSLYVTDANLVDFKKISDDKAVYINVDENYIYYVRANNTRQDSYKNILLYNNTGIYRIHQNGSNIKSISYNPAAYLILKGNNLYYQKYDVEKGLFLHQNSTEGTDERLLIEEAVIPAIIIDDALYYAGLSQDHNFNQYDLSSYNGRTFYEGGFLYPTIHDGYLYYMNVEDNYKIYRMRFDGSSPEIVVNKRCATFNITNKGKFLYYQVDDSNSNGINRIYLETMEPEVLLAGNYKQIHVTENYVFFRDFDDTTTFVVEAEGNPKVATFTPPNLSVPNK